MEELFKSVVTAAAGTPQTAVTTPQLLMLMSQASGSVSLCDTVLKRLETANEQSSVDLVSQLLNICVREQVSPEVAEDVVEKLLTFAEDKMSWTDTMRWIAALIHFHATDDITVSIFFEFGAVDFANKLIDNHTSDPMCVAAGVALLSHFNYSSLGDGIKLLVKALDVLNANEFVCKLVCRCLAEFTSYYGGSSDWLTVYTNEFLAADGVAKLEKVLLVHKDSEDVQLFGCRVVANLSAVSPDGYLENTQIMSRVNDTLRQYYATNPALAGHALYALSYFPDDADVELLATILETSSSETTVQDCVRCLSSIATHVKESKPKIAKTGIVSKVLETMTKYSTNQGLIEEGSNLISYMAYDSSSITTSITMSGGIQLILTAMKQFSDNGSLLAAAAAALSGLTFNNSQGQEMVARGNGIKLIVESMRNLNHTRLHEMACLAIGTMCWNNDLKTQVVTNDGIAVLLASLDVHRESGSLVKNACRALAQIAFNNDIYRDMINQTDAGRLVIASMQLHPHHDRAQMHGCVALSYLSWKSDSQQSYVIDGHRVIINAMKNHEMSSDVQEHACRALANIGSMLPPAEAKESLEQIVNAARRYDRCADVQEEACRAMVTLSLQCNENKDVLASLGAPERVIYALQAFPNNYSVQQEACNALAHLAYEHQDLNQTVTGLGGVSLLLAAMRTHPSNSRVQLTACGGLSALAFDNAVAQRQIYDQGGVDCVIAAMRNFPRLRIMELSCSVLGTLAWNTDIKEAVAVVAIPEILNAMSAHHESPLLQKATSRAVSQFAFNSEKNRKILFDAGAVPLIIKSLRTHMRTDKLVSHALVALTYLCWENGTVAEAILKEGAEALLEEVCQEYRNHDKIHNKAQHLSKILVRKSSSPTMKSPVPGGKGGTPPIGSPVPLEEDPMSPLGESEVYPMSPISMGREERSFYTAPQDHERAKHREEPHFRGARRGGGARACASLFGSLAATCSRLAIEVSWHCSILAAIFARNGFRSTYAMVARTESSQSKAPE